MPPVETLHARSTPAKAGSADIRLLAFEDHLRFVIMHLLKHGAWRPSGLCDVAAMVEAVPPGFDWDLCLGNDPVAAGWIGATIMLAHRLLGCRLDTTPPAVRADPPAWFERAVLREWEAPYAGRFRSVAASALAKNPGEFLHWLRVRWPTPVAALIEARSPVNTPRCLPDQVAASPALWQEAPLDISARLCRVCVDQHRRGRRRHTSAWHAPFASRVISAWRQIDSGLEDEQPRGWLAHRVPWIALPLEATRQRSRWRASKGLRVFLAGVALIWALWRPMNGLWDRPGAVRDKVLRCAVGDADSNRPA